MPHRQESREPEEEYVWTLNRFRLEVYLGLSLAGQAHCSLSMNLREPAEKFLLRVEKCYKNALHIIVTFEELNVWQGEELRSELASLTHALTVLHRRIHDTQVTGQDRGEIIYDPEIFRKEMIAAGDVLLKALELENSLGDVHTESGSPEAQAQRQATRRLVESTQTSYDEAMKRYREAVARAAEERTQHLSKSTILLLEDERMIANLLKKMLELEGATVLCARDGEEALSLCRQHRGEIRLVVADVILRSGALGVEIAHQLANLEPDLAVLLISGYPKEHLENRGLLDPGKMPFRKASFLMKPFSAAKFQERIRELSD